jgi:SAM-dependent methyltransferase
VSYKLGYQPLHRLGRRARNSEQPMPDDDVPSPIDFHDLAQARQWERDTIEARPWRPAFFAAFVSALNGKFDRLFTVQELGSGPGHLAERILSGCAVAKCGALDFSDAMHQLARERLTRHLAKVNFISRDFRLANWGDGIGSFDALVTMQAAHELRHKRHLAKFLLQARALLRHGGLILYCDHYAEPVSHKHPDLYLKREDQPGSLETAGFSNVRRLLDEGGMALYSADAV